MSSNKCTCDGGGWLRRKIGSNFFVYPCYCTLQRRKQKLVGSLFATASLNSTPYPGQAKAMDILRAQPEAGYYLWGAYGTGKTFLAACQFDHALQHDPDHVAWLSDTALAGMSRDPEDLYLDSLIRRLEESSRLWHVFLDDLGKSRMSDWVRQDMYRLVNAAYVNQHRLTITSNYSLDQLARDDDPRMPGGAIMRRVDSMVIKCKI